MCGITGFFTDKHSNLSELISDMTNTMLKRGPDGHGKWFDDKAGVALGHRRLSVIDVSEAGHQPMVSSCGRYIIVYNGEVYNFKELRSELEAEGRVFRGFSDTEVILEACVEWGVEATVGRLIGMFAFGLWDREERILILVRDRLGSLIIEKSNLCGKRHGCNEFVFRKKIDIIAY